MHCRFGFSGTTPLSSGMIIMHACKLFELFDRLQLVQNFSEDDFQVPSGFN